MTALTAQLTAIEDRNCGSTERREPHDYQGEDRIMNRHLAAEVFNYNEATILNDCVCYRVKQMTLPMGRNTTHVSPYTILEIAGIRLPRRLYGKSCNASLQHYEWK